MAAKRSVAVCMMERWLGLNRRIWHAHQASDLWQLPGGSARPVEHRVSLGISREKLSHGIPLELAAEFDRYISEMTDGADPVADIHRKIGILAAFEALQEIVVFALRIGIEMEFLGADDRLEDFG